MKKTILTAVLTAGLAGRLCAAVAEDSKIFTPYFDMTMTEAGFMPSQGNLFSGGNINTQVGLLTKIAKNDQIFGLYNFNYSGQGFAPQDTKQFTDRSTYVNGKEVEVDGRVRGLTAGLDEDGFLLLKTMAGIERVISGGVRRI